MNSDVSLSFNVDPAPRLTVPWRHPARVLRAEQVLPVPLEQVFPFFADAGNLEALTPPWIRFRIDTPRPIAMHEGAIIEYHLRIRGLPIRWRTRITCWEPGVRFIDMQERGPYRLWHHEHRFEALPGGTRCVDIVHYAHIGTPIGERLMVRPDLRRIFAFRARALAARFR